MFVGRSFEREEGAILERHFLAKRICSLLYSNPNIKNVRDRAATETKQISTFGKRNNNSIKNTKQGVNAEVFCTINFYC